MQYKVLNFFIGQAIFLYTYIYSLCPIFEIDSVGPEKIAIFTCPVLRLACRFRLTDSMKESEFIRRVVPLRDGMFRFAQRILLRADDAEDVTHDLLERLWADRDRLDECRNIPAFVMAAVRNRCYDRIRQRQAGERRDGALAAWAERSTTDDAAGWEARELVRRAMGCLPDRQREALHLKDIEGYPTCEIAGMLGCDEASVRVLLSRARSALREAVKKMIDDDETER